MHDVGLHLVIGLQSLAQAQARWGEDAARALFTAMDAELVLGGLNDPGTLERYARLAGEVDVDEVNFSYTPGRGAPTGASSARQTRAVIREDEIRRLPRHHALLVYRDLPPTLLQTSPWWEGPHGARLEAQREQARARRLAGN